MIGKRTAISALVTAACAALSTPAAAAAEGTAAPPEVAAAPAAVETGRLANGLDYAILPRRGEGAGVAILMRVRGGFHAESRPGERGLAHLIEHLVFLGPTDAAPDTFRRFRDVGFPLTFRDPAGGTTSWRESDYFVVAKSPEDDGLDKLIGLFREVASGLTIRPDEVEIARADVLREMADKRLGNEIFARYIAAVAPGSPTDLIDAQNSDDVPSASIETIRKLYARLYRPTNTSLVIVGDVDPAKVKAMIESHFSGWKAMGANAPRQMADRTAATEATQVSFSDLPSGRNIVLVTNAAPLAKAPASREQGLGESTMAMIATRAANMRIAERYPDYPERKAGFYIDEESLGFRQMMFWDEFVPGRWQPAVSRLSGVTCDLANSGFTPEEARKAAEAVLGDLKAQAAGAGPAYNSWLAKGLADAMTTGAFYLTPDERLAFASSFVGTITADGLNRWWKDQWASGRAHLRLEVSDGTTLNDPERTIASAGECLFPPTEHQGNGSLSYPSWLG